MLHYVPYSPEIRFCGPTALAALSNLKPKDIHEYLVQTVPPNRMVNGFVKGMYNSELTNTLSLMGYTFDEKDFNQGLGPNCHYRARRRYISLRKFMATHGRLNTWIINVTGHYMAVYDGFICDTVQRMPHLLNLRDRPKRNVLRAWLIHNP